jgi:excisionase family DNA binding protein
MASRTETIAPLALSIGEVVSATGVGRTKVYAAIGSGDLATVKIGKRTLVLMDDLQAWLRRHRDARTGPPKPPGNAEPTQSGPAKSSSKKGKLKEVA